jgi:hypothetical protein
VLALAFIAGVGLCGLDFFLANKGIGKSTEELGVGPLDNISLIVMLLSLVGLVIALLAWAVNGIIRAFRRGDNGAQKLLDKKDEKDKLS